MRLDGRGRLPGYAWLTASAVILTCCSSEPSSTTGVNDVRKACEIRAGWTRARSTSCVSCDTTVSSPRCECNDKPNSGRCHEYVVARANEPSCAGVPDCVRVCAADCACIDDCYSGKDACRARAAAADGCIADVCDADCR